MLESNWARDLRKGAQTVRRLGIDPALIDPRYVAFCGRRMAIRIRVVWAALVPILAVFALYSRDFFGLPEDPNATQTRHLSLWGAVMVSAVGAIMLLAREIASRRELRAAGVLPTRVGGTETLTELTVLGSLRLVVLIVIFGVNLSVLVGLFTLSSPNATACRGGYLLGFVCCAIVVAVGVRRATRRPTIAMDSASLAVDERLRSGQALAGLYALALLMAVATPPISTAGEMPNWLLLAHSFGLAGSLVLLSIAQLLPPWKDPLQRLRRRGVSYQ